MHEDIRTAAVRRITEEAAQWLIANREGLDAASRREFMAWLRHSPAHVGEYMAIVQWDQDMHDAARRESMPVNELTGLAASEPAVVPLHPGMPGDMLTAKAHARESARRWPWVAVAAAIAMAAVATWQLTRHPGDVPGVVYTAPDDATRSLALDDGSRIQLDRGASIRVRFEARRRDIAVLGGTMLIDVGHRSTAPLSVTLGNTVLRDIGTVFQVRHATAGGDVTVLSGAVDASTTQAPNVIAHLKRGQRAAFATDGSVAHLASGDDVSADLAWLPADIDVRDMSIADVARRFNDYGRAPLLIDDDTVGARRISGRFHPRDPAGFIAYLKSIPGVHVHSDGEGVHVGRL